ncbi:hypothetical protein N7513_012370 [Penicillium frequentans]|uniref:Extracellular membrane protein CFEM domain-containing protein n=1 Tax=Penicillium frequentans TaxID=3151616 RepID=A0AAD6D3T7_9EURO|nr:hypothetical protein N7513_012370 [Penicillium glabrum]KAJ5547253.1 hypothetical protein N7494_004838 [Penicillium glabrum]
MQASVFILGLIASITNAIPTPETQSTCLNEFEVCRVNAPMGDPHQCCISNMICQPFKNQSNGTMGVCIKENDEYKLPQ